MVAASDAQQYALLQTNITNFVNQWTDYFITGSKSLGSDWNSFVHGVQALGLAQYLQMSQSAMGKTPMDTQSTLLEPNPAQIKFLLSLK